jgi:hypothetical protein
MTDSVAAHPGVRRATGLLAFVAFILMIGAWSFAAPFDGTPDEQAHIVRAAGVAEGQLTPTPTAAALGTGAFQSVPAGLLRVNCWRYHVTRSAACAQAPGSQSTLVRTGTQVGRYNPVYYLVVGWPLRVRPGMGGVLLSRLISAAICAALLAGAFVSVARWSRYRLMVAGLLAAATPMALQMASAVNPNGVEIAAGIGLFASAIPLLFTPVGQRLDRRLLVLVAVNGAVLATVRALGPLWLATAMIALLLPTRIALLRTLWRSWTARVAVAVLTVAVLASAVWTVAMKASQLGGDSVEKSTTLGYLSLRVLDKWGGLVDQMVGVMSWLDTYLPQPVYLIWEVTGASLVIWAVLHGSWVDRWRLFAILLGGAILPSVLDIANAPQTGLVLQGRYLLPPLVGVLLLAGYLVEERGAVNPAVARRLVRLFVVVLLPLQVGFLVFTMVRWQAGIHPLEEFGQLNPLGGDWHPEVGSLLPLLMMVFGATLLGVLAWRVAAPAGASGLPAGRTAAGVTTADVIPADGGQAVSVPTQPSSTPVFVPAEPDSTAADAQREQDRHAERDNLPVRLD